MQCNIHVSATFERQLCGAAVHITYTLVHASLAEVALLLQCVGGDQPMTECSYKFPSRTWMVLTIALLSGPSAASCRTLAPRPQIRFRHLL